MNNDLISANFSNNVNRDVIKQNISLLFVLLVLFSIYIIFNIIDWYLLLVTVKSLTFSNVSNYYFYRIYPIISMIGLIIGLAVWFFYLKGHKLILESFEKDNADVFNKGYASLNIATKLNITGYSIILLSATTRYILKYFL